MKISFLKERHPEIYKRVIDECENQKSVILVDDSLSSCFYWAETKEGILIWSYVEEGNFQPFYDFHKLPNPDNKKVKGEFYNTTNIKGEELVKSQEKALSQTQQLLEKLLMFEKGEIFSAWICHNKTYLHHKTPVSSYRRTLNSLEADGKVEKVGKRVGDLNAVENTYKLIL